MESTIGLAEHLASASKADSSLKKYNSYWRHFESWATRHNLPYLPASPNHVALYLAEASKTAKSMSVCNARFYAIKWMHNLCGLADPCVQKIPQLVLEGCKRTASAAGKSAKKDYVSKDMLVALCAKFGGDSASLRDLRFCCMAVLAFAGFLRISEILSLRKKRRLYFRQPR